jgi:hypothetical protein
VSVTGDGSGAACLDATITKRHGSRGTTVAIGEPTENEGSTWVNVYPTLRVDGSLPDCKPVYMLYIKDTNDGDTYKPAEEFLEILRGEVGELTSRWTFKEHTGEVSWDLSDRDVKALRPRFTVGGVTSVDCRVIAMQPGSQTDGPLATLTDLPSSDFSITILD